MNSFRAKYSRAFLTAAITFVSVYSVQVLVVIFARNHSMSFNPTALITLVAFALLQLLVFIPTGWILAYFPAKLLSHISINGKSLNLLNPLAGAMMGIVFLPLCASVAYFLLHEEDGPTFLSRCNEYFLSMTIAGAVGGYVFSRFVINRHGSDTQPCVQADVHEKP